MGKRLREEDLREIPNHLLLEKLVQKGIDHKLSGNHDDYLESLDYFFESKRRMEKVNV
jgi:hypothetical protein